MRVHITLDEAAEAQATRLLNFHRPTAFSAVVRRALALLDGHTSALTGDLAAETIERARFAEFRRAGGVGSRAAKGVNQ